MAHELDITDGVVSFADSRMDAWHKLGQRVGHTMTAAEVMAEAHLAGWNVRKEAIVIPQDAVITDEGVTAVAPLTIPDRFATVRSNPVTGAAEYLGVVGAKYEPVQNEASADLLNTLVSESGAHFETAAALLGGRQTFLTMKLPQAMEITGSDGAVDETEWYLAALNSHDGSTKWRVILTPVRIVCMNTQTWALRSARSSFAYRHTSGAGESIAEARRVLGITWKSMGVIEDEFQRMAETEFTGEQMQSFADDLIKVAEVDPKSTAATRRANTAGQIVKLWSSSPTIANIAGTRYAAYNAVTEYVDHYQPVRGADDESIARALRTIRDAESETSLKAQAFAMLRVPA